MGNDHGIQFKSDPYKKWDYNLCCWKFYVFQMVKSEEVLTESTNTNFFLSDVVKEEIQVRI